MANSPRMYIPGERKSEKEGMVSEQTKTRNFTKITLCQENKDVHTVSTGITLKGLGSLPVRSDVLTGI